MIESENDRRVTQKWNLAYIAALDITDIWDNARVLL